MALHAAVGQEFDIAYAEAYWYPMERVLVQAAVEVQAHEDDEQPVVVPV